MVVNIFVYFLLIIVYFAETFVFFASLFHGLCSVITVTAEQLV
jgi:hypothetical protein